MNKLLKNVFIVVLAVILLGLTNTTYAATTGSLVLSKSSETCEPGQQFTVSVSVSNFNATSQEMTFRGKVAWSTEKLELVSATSASGWSNMSSDSRFNKSTGKFNLDNDDGVGANSKVFDLTFKVKEGATGEATVSIVNVDMYDGNFSDVSTKINIAEPVKEDEDPNEDTPPASENPPAEDKTDTGNTQTEQKPATSDVQSETSKTDSKPSGNDTTTKPGVLPQTGVNYFLWCGVAICVLSAVAIVVFYQRAKYIARRQK